MFLDKKLNKDPKYQKFRLLVDKNKFSIDSTEITKELKTLHVTRIVRSLDPKNLINDNQSNLINASIQNQAIRSRVVEIKMECYTKYNLLDNYVSKLKDYLISQYNDDFKELKTIKEKQGYLSNFFSGETTMLNEINTVIEICDILIEDLDKSAWSIKALVELLDLTVKRENII